MKLQQLPKAEAIRLRDLLGVFFLKRRGEGGFDRGVAGMLCLLPQELTDSGIFLLDLVGGVVSLGLAKKLVVKLL